MVDVETLSRSIFECTANPPPPLDTHVKGPANELCVLTCDCKWGFTLPGYGKGLSPDKAWARHLSVVKVDRGDWESAQNLQPLVKALEGINDEKQRIEPGLALWKSLLSAILQWQQDFLGERPRPHLKSVVEEAVTMLATANLRPSILEMQRIQEFLPGVEIDSKLREITKQNRLPPIRITSTDVAADLVAQLAAKKVNTEGVPMVASLSALRSQAEKSTKPKAMLSGEPAVVVKEELAAVKKAKTAIDVGVDEQSYKSLESALGECEILRERLERVVQLAGVPAALQSEVESFRELCKLSAEQYEQEMYALWDGEDDEHADERQSALLATLQSTAKAAASDNAESSSRRKNATPPAPEPARRASRRQRRKPAAILSDDEGEEDDDDDVVEDDDDDDDVPSPPARRKPKKKAAPRMRMTPAKPPPAARPSPVKQAPMSQMPAAKPAVAGAFKDSRVPAAAPVGSVYPAAGYAPIIPVPDEPAPPSPFFPRGIIFARGVNASVFHHLAGFAWLFAVIFKHSSVGPENPLRSGLEECIRLWRFDFNNIDDIVRQMHNAEPPPQSAPVMKANMTPFHYLRGKSEIDEVVTELIRRLPIALLQSVYDLLSNPGLAPFFSQWDPIVQEYAEYLHMRLWAEMRFLAMPCCQIYKPAEVEFAAAVLQQGMAADVCFVMYQNQRPWRAAAFGCLGDLRNREPGAKQCHACEGVSRMLYQLSAASQNR